MGGREGCEDDGGVDVEGKQRYRKEERERRRKEREDREGRKGSTGREGKKRGRRKEGSVWRKVKGG